jgi:hypothetical protein
MCRHFDTDALRRISHVLVDPGAKPWQLRDAVTELHALLAKVCDMEVNSPSPEDAHETLLATGKAISPVDAGRCLLDLARTSKFLRGVRAAVDEAHRRFPGETIHVLYAGCGPFAPLVLPLTTVFDPEEMQFTLLDIHDQSLRHVRRIVEGFGLSAFVRDHLQCDATAYHHGDAAPFHVVVIEAMQRALDKEPQVAIAMNLVPQLADGGIMIPERITLTAALADLTAEIMGRPKEGKAPEVCDGTEARRERVVLGVPFELTIETALAFGQESCRDTSSEIRCLPAHRVQNRPPLHGGQELALFTTITVFDSIVLGDYESGLTYPTRLPLRKSTADPNHLPFVYRLGPKPGLAYADSISQSA